MVLITNVYTVSHTNKENQYKDCADIRIHYFIVINFSLVLCI